MQPSRRGEADMTHRARALVLVVGILLSAALTEGQALAPIPGHPPVTVSGIVNSFEPATGILRFEDGRLVKLTGESKVVRPAGAVVRTGDAVALQDVLPVGVQAGVKSLAVGKPQRMATVASVDEPAGLVRLTDGTTVRVTGTTNVHRGATGSSVILTDLKPGDELVVVLGAVDATPPTAGDVASALVRQDRARPAEALEIMIFAVPGRP
jgi:hypothetical protein